MTPAGSPHATTERPSLRILLVDDQSLVREALRGLLETTLHCEVVDVGSAGEALRIVSADAVDLVLLDVRMPDVDGIEALRQIRRVAPSVPVVILSSFDEVNDVDDALEEGARGYILKGATSQQLREAIDTAISGAGVYVHPTVTEHLLRAHRASAGRKALTERELVVLTSLCEGASNELIAQRLSVSLKTVKTQLSSVFRKLGVSNRTAAVARALRDGIV